MNTQTVGPDVLLTPAEVAAILYVDPKTVTRWALAGKVRCVRTPGGHRRFFRSEILALATVARSPERAPWPPAADRVLAPTSSAPDGQDSHPGGPAPSSTGADRQAHRQAAAAVVARAVAVAREEQAVEAAHALILTRCAVGAAASIAADAAEKARADRAAAAASAADALASSAGRAAAAVQRQADASATRLREAAAQAATLVAAASRPGVDREAALAALHLAAAVQTAAVSAAEDTAAAAASVAAAVAAAAADVARRVSDLDVAIEAEVAKVAAAVQTTATATARRVAAETDARATSVAMLAQEAATAAVLADADADRPWAWEQATPVARAHRAEDAPVPRSSVRDRPAYARTAGR